MFGVSLLFVAAAGLAPALFGGAAWALFGLPLGSVPVFRGLPSRCAALRCSLWRSLALPRSSLVAWRARSLGVRVGLSPLRHVLAGVLRRGRCATSLLSLFRGGIASRPPRVFMLCVTSFGRTLVFSLGEACLRLASPHLLGCRSSRSYRATPGLLIDPSAYQHW